MSEKPTRLSTIVVGPEEERFSTGIAGLDACLAEAEDTPQGLPYGVSVLLSGQPGSGKSTIATYIAASQKETRDSLILHGEEKADRVRRRWDRLGLKDADPYLAPLKATEDALDVIRDLNADESARGIGVCLVDSIQTVTLNGRRKWQDQLEAAEQLCGQVTSSGGSIVLVSHVDKSGATHQGAAALAHVVDIHIHVTTNAKKNERILEVRKNRIGRAGFQVPINITPSGLSVGTPAPLSPNAGLGMARTQLEKAAETAYALLLEGKRLDGYDFDLAGVNGGIWRSGLEMATKRLVRDGFEIVEEKIKGRRGYRMLNPPAKDSDGLIIVATPVGIDDNNELISMPGDEDVVQTPKLSLELD